MKMPLLCRRVVGRIRTTRSRDGVPAGRRDVPIDHFATLLTPLGGSISHLLLPHAFEVAAQPNRKWILLLSLFNSPLVDRYACFYAWSLANWPEELDSTAHDVFALCCALDATLRAEHGPEELPRLVEELHATPGLCLRPDLNELLALLREVWSHTDDAHALNHDGAGFSNPGHRTGGSLSEANAVYETARAARVAGDFGVAAPGFMEGARLASRSGESVVLFNCLLGLGNIAKQRGNAPRARHWYQRAERLARQEGRRELIGMALHDQFSLAVELGNLRLAEKLGAAALEQYGSSDPRFFRLAHDQGYCWMLQGRFRDSLAVFEETVAHFTDPGEQMLAWACLARAAGGAGVAGRFDRARIQVQARADLLPGDIHVGHALLNVARGAASLGQFELAYECGSLALQEAERKGQGLLRFEAEAFLDSRSGELAATLQAPRNHERRPRKLAGALVTRLRKLAVG